ncbi:glycosyltransferase [Prevotella koreensis]|uniref:Glycosyltransferase n=1 Tax=Prevotella koreensis TaxID=2490854 RepID=A0A432LND9_9BACT|nr:glycosyltransferase [Prevotella koreensis]
MFRLKTLDIIESKGSLSTLPIGKCLINTINAHSYNTAQKDALFAEALLNGDALIPDGASIVKACKWLNAKSQPRERIAGWDLFVFEMRRLNDEQLRVGSNVQAANVNSEPNDDRKQPKVMFMGSSEKVLELIREKAKREYPNLETVTYSPPYKPEFSDEDNAAIVKAINDADPDLLWIGMTAPKQEKWVYKHWHELDINCHCGTIGAVFDFFAGTTKRAPLWWQEHSLEWLYRLIIEPRRMWRRYIIGNALFLWNIIKEKA